MPNSKIPAIGMLSMLSRPLSPPYLPLILSQRSRLGHRPCPDIPLKQIKKAYAQHH